MDVETLKILKNVAKKNYEKISNSASFLGICTENFVEDPICLIQLSTSILLDKPLFLLIEKGTKIPKKLIRILDGYEFYEIGNIKSLQEASDNLLSKVQSFLLKLKK